MWNSTPVVAPPFLECPDLYRAGETVVMIASYNDFAAVPGLGGQDGMSAEWRTGRLDPAGSSGAIKFITRRMGVLDYGAFYAPKSAGEATDPTSGRRVLFAFTGWHERLGGGMNEFCGISHLMPRDLTVAPDGRLHIVPVPEISNLALGTARPLVTNGTAQTLGAQLMVMFTCSGLPPLPTRQTATARSVGIDVLLDSAAAEWTRVGYDLDSGEIFVDQSHTNAADRALSDAVQRSAPLHEVSGEAVTTLNITVLVDGGLLESYANRQVVISSLLSPSTNSSSEPGARQVRAFSAAAVPPGVTCSGEAWAMKSIPH
eukprot:SAG11_NODE_3919_length_2148_cov_2.631040_1_plen_316_part_00